MGFKIIYGRSGTGKSTYIFNEIAQKLEKQIHKKIYIVTPEQFSFTAEKKLLESIGTNAVLDAEVLTFNRMAYRVLQELKRAKIASLSTCGKSMLVYDILEEKRKELKFIGKSLENVQLVGRQITEFKKHGVTVEKLKQATLETQDEYLKAKMQDMLQVYSQYDEVIQNEYIDENDSLSILAENLQYIESFKDCDIYIDEFAGFTKQEYEVLKALIQNQNHITMTVCTDEAKTSIVPDTDIFYANKQTLDRVFQIVQKENISIEEVALEKRYRFKNEELKHLEQNIYAVPYQKYQNHLNHIQLFLAANEYSEIEHICQEIVKLVRDKQYRYNDIAVVTKNLESYSNLCKAIFHQYHIPVFIDEKKDLSQNILVRYLLAILNIFAKNWTYESMFEYIKTGFLEIDHLDVHLLENYCLKWGIKGSKWYKSDWDFYDETEEVKEKILHMKEQIVPKLLSFKQKLAGIRDVKNITKQLYQFLIENDIDKKLEKKVQLLCEKGKLEKAKEYETSWKIVMDVLDEIILVLGEKKVSFEKYAEILKMGLGNSGLGKIPATQDQVIVGDVDRSRSHRVRAVFMIGLNDGVFPNINKNEGFFNDNDREKLKQCGAELAKGSLEKLYDDNFNIYKAFTAAEEELYLSYASSDLEGKTLRASILISRIKKIFPNLEEKSDIVTKNNEIITEEVCFEDLLNQIRKLKENDKLEEEEEKTLLELFYFYGRNEKWKDRLFSTMQAISYTNKPHHVSSMSIQKLYGNTLKTSISRLEQYRACPFSYYLKYGLKLSEQNKFQIGAIDTGTFMHDVIDEFFEILQEQGLQVKTITDEEIKKIIDQIMEEKLGLKKNYIFTSIPKYRVLSSRLKRVIKRSMKYIIESLKYSKFDILGHELEFKQGKEYKPIEFVLDSGKKVEITGKIDRIDIAKTAEGKYIRIIDYKSSIKDINLNEVQAGLQLQLLTYLDAVCEVNDLLPAGVLYFNLIDPSIKSDKRLTDEEIELEIRKQFKMKGLILADVDIVRMMDTKLEKGSSNIVPAYIDKEGNLSNKSNSVTRKEFEKLQKYTKHMIKQIGEEILTGNIEIKPYYKVKGGKTPCEYCKYKPICNFNNGICPSSYRYIGNIAKDTILENM